MRLSAWVSISRSSPLSSTRRMESIRDPYAKRGNAGPEAGATTSICHRTGHALPPCLVLHVFQLLLGLIQLLLLEVQLLAVIALLLGPGGLVAQGIAGIGVVSRGAQAILTLHYVNFSFQQR